MSRRRQGRRQPGRVGRQLGKRQPGRNRKQLGRRLLGKSARRQLGWKKQGIEQREWSRPGRGRCSW